MAGTAGDSRGHGQSYQGEPAGALTLRQASQGDPAEHKVDTYYEFGTIYVDVDIIQQSLNTYIQDV